MHTRVMSIFMYWPYYQYCTLLTLYLFQLLDFLADGDSNTSECVLVFVREAVQRYPQLKPSIITRLIEVFSQIRNAEVHRSTLWILGEYCTSVEDIFRLVAEIRTAIGEVQRTLVISLLTLIFALILLLACQIPIVDSELRKSTTEDSDDTSMLHECAVGCTNSTLKAYLLQLVTSPSYIAVLCLILQPIQ